MCLIHRLNCETKVYHRRRRGFIGGAEFKMDLVAWLSQTRTFFWWASIRNWVDIAKTQPILPFHTYCTVGGSHSISTNSVREVRGHKRANTSDPKFHQSWLPWSPGNLYVPLYFSLHPRLLVGQVAIGIWSLHLVNHWHLSTTQSHPGLSGYPNK